MRSRLISIIVLVAAFLTACGADKNKARAIGEAFVGPITLNLRSELAPGAKTVASVKHGERVEIIQTRRRFIKVRTASGAEGWTDSRRLMNTTQMAELNELADRSARLPSQGQATVWGTLNIHAEPYRQSVSFHQLHERDRAHVVWHQVVPRNAQPPDVQLTARPAPAPRKRASDDAEKLPPLQQAPAPAPPKNWLELSRTAPLMSAPEEQKRTLPQVPMDDWNLVRMQSRRAGWALARNLVMAIPDEVAQYAEGHRITSYFSMGTVDDHGVTKHHWLWTTNSQVAVPYEFDSFRYFVWNMRRHRYETAYIERGLEGYYPTIVEKGSPPRFSVVVREKDGKLYRKTYTYEIYRVRLVGKAPAERLPSPYTSGGETLLASSQPDADEPDTPAKPSLSDRLRNWAKRLWN